MSEIALVSGSNQVLVLFAPVAIFYRGRPYVLVETARHGLLLESGVSARENGLTRLTATLDTTPL